MEAAPAPASVREGPRDGQATAAAGSRIARVIVQGEAAAPSPHQEADRAQAVADLEAENLFTLLPDRGGSRADGGLTGPYVLLLSLQEGRLVFEVRRQDDSPLHLIVLALGPFRRLIKDYQLLIDAYETALAEGREARIQAVDMGRRGLHDEGAGLLRERLQGKAEMDFATARRLFTLVCALHQRI